MRQRPSPGDQGRSPRPCRSPDLGRPRIPPVSGLHSCGSWSPPPYLSYCTIYTIGMFYTSNFTSPPPANSNRGMWSGIRWNRFRQYLERCSPSVRNSFHHGLKYAFHETPGSWAGVLRNVPVLSGWIWRGENRGGGGRGGRGEWGAGCGGLGGETAFDNRKPVEGEIRTVSLPFTFPSRA